MIDFVSVAEDFQLILKAVNAIEGFYSKNDSEIERLKNFLKERDYYLINNIDYDLYGSTFNAAYYKKNLLKSLLFFREIFDLLPHEDITIREIGCGAAPSSSALTLLYRKNFQREVSVELIDLSRKQLEYAIIILNSINIRIQNISVKSYDIKTDAAFSGLSIFSYFLCEQDYHAGEALYQSKNDMAGGFAVIDYETTINQIQSYFLNEYDEKLVVINKCYSIPEELISLFGYEEITLHGCYYRA